MTKKIIIFLASIFFISCMKNEADYSIWDKVIYYKYSDSDITDFSFLGKYKNLEILDLSGSVVRDISFVKKMKKLKILVLEKTKIKNYKSVKDRKKNPFYNKFLKIEPGEFNRNRLFLILDNDLEELDLIKQNIKLNDNIIYSGILGTTHFSKLKNLKVILDSDNYIDSLTVLDNLEELHIMGNVKKLPYFQKSLKSLYLYNLDLEDYSFLNNSNIIYLYIVTKDFNSKKWKLLANKYPWINIKIKNLLWLPILIDCDILNSENLNYNIDYTRYYKTRKHFKIKNYYLTGDYSICKVISFLRDNDFPDLFFSLEDYIFFLNEVNIDINYLWKHKITLLDKAIEDENMEAIEYLIDHGAKQSCEILKEKCSELPDDIQKIIDKNR